MRLIVKIAVTLSLCVFSAAAAAEEKPAKEYYYELLMGKALQDKIGYVPSGMSEKVGDKNSYREGIRGYRHKAFSSCLTWDKETLTVSYSSWDAFGSGDWSYAEFGALRACLRKKKQYNKTCTCQTIDHDDENVLKVPEDFLKLYQERQAARTE